MTVLRRSLGVLLILLAKMGGLLLKLLKGLKFAKFGLGAATFGSYALLTDWRFAAVILFVIGIHESGHVWAMRRSGVPTRGFYFLPFVGGVAIADAPMPDRESTVFMALAGPVWGFGATLFIYAGFLYTGNPLWEVAACWGAFVNLLNLLPMAPLDGGHVVKALSAGRGLALAGTLSLQVAALAFCLAHGYVFFFVIGLVEWSGTFFGLVGASYRSLKTRWKSPLVLGTASPQFLWYAAAADLLGLPPTTNVRGVHRALRALRLDPRLAPNLEAMRQVLADFDAWKAGLTEKDKWAFDGVSCADAWALEHGSFAEFYKYDTGKLVRTSPNTLTPKAELLERFLVRRAELRVLLERADAAFFGLYLYVDAKPSKALLAGHEFPRWLATGSVLLDLPSVFRAPYVHSDWERLRSEDPVFALADPRLEQQVLDQWNLAELRPSTELPPLTPGRAALWSLTYAGLIFLLFSFMEMTGGEEAASHASGFFRNFYN